MRKFTRADHVKPRGHQFNSIGLALPVSLSSVVLLPIHLLILLFIFGKPELLPFAAFILVGVVNEAFNFALGGLGIALAAWSFALGIGLVGCCRRISWIILWTLCLPACSVEMTIAVSIVGSQLVHSV